MSFSADTRSFRICVLAYSRILHIVHDVIRQLPDTGVEYIVIEAGLADHDACVTRAIPQGSEIFVAGPAGATLFANHYSYPVIPFQVQDIDYLRAIRTALDQGYQHIGIMHFGGNFYGIVLDDAVPQLQAGKAAFAEANLLFSQIHSFYLMARLPCALGKRCRQRFGVAALTGT